MSRELLFAVAAGLASALAGTAFLTGSAGAVFMIYLAPLPLMLSGLGLGLKAGTIAAATGFGVTMLLGGSMVTALYGLIHGLPAILLTRLALMQRTNPDGTAEWYPAGGLACWMAAFAAAVMLATATLWFTGEGGIAGAVERYLTQGIKALMPTVDEARRAGLVKTMAAVFPGLVGCSWVAMICVNALVAEGVLTRAGRALRPRPVYSDLTLPDWISWLFVAAAGLSLIGHGDLQYIGRNVAMVLALPFFLLGLAVVHTLARRVQFSGALLAGMYVVLMMSSWALLVVTGVGLIEQWAGLRRRFAGPAPE